MLTKVLPKNKINEIMTALIGVFGAVSYFVYIGPLNFIGRTLTPLPDFLLFNQLSEAMHLKYGVPTAYIVAIMVILMGCVIYVILFKLLLKYGQHDFATETIQRTTTVYKQQIMTPVQAFRFKDVKMLFRDFRE
ncbi:MAG: hypothetical protein UH078_02245 [Macrococcus canis]|nr:hypothetical protein [Macrococcus canis]MEE1106783.1 hypothetical protein [Macrococcus canis]